MTDPFPRPPKLLVAASVLVIAANLALVSAFMASTIADLDPMGIIGAGFVLPICLFLAAQQYRGTFRRVQSAALATSIMLYIIGAFLLFTVVTSTTESVRAGISLRPMLSFLLPMLAVGLSCLAVGRMNSLWSRKMLAAMEDGVEPPMQRGFSLRELLLGVGVLAAMLGVGFYLIRTTPPPHGEHIEASAAPFDLPAGATDVSYGKGARGTIAYEFTVAEPAFREWVNSGIGSIEAQAAGIALQEITTPFAIHRYGSMGSGLSGPEKIAIDQGLFYAWSKEDRGVYAAFDRTTGRAYYHAHYH